MSPTYISLFIAQLKEEGYSIFAVRGEIPTCEADLLSQSFDPKTHKPKPKNPIDMITEMQTKYLQSRNNQDDEDEMLKRAIALSNEEDDELERAIRLSMQEK